LIDPETELAELVASGLDRSRPAEDRLRDLRRVQELSRETGQTTTWTFCLPGRTVEIDVIADTIRRIESGVSP
jgi:hypothetical protein